ncbi:DUF2777 family protein, partial [Bacillus vallismortis]|nr:DUF2777 family protein [Bacillus vallismortis]
MNRTQPDKPQHRTWENGTIFIEDGICLIANGEGEILLADGLHHSPMWIQGQGKGGPGSVRSRVGVAGGG